MAVLDTLKVVIEGDASGLQSAFTVATRVLQKLEAALDRLEASASKHTQATDRIAAAHTRMAATTKVAADKTAAALSKAAAKQEASAERSTASWAKEIAIFQRYRAALYLVGAGLQSVYKIAEDGARAAAAEQYFRNAGKSIVEFRTATRGLISDAELMKKVNLADTMGLSGEVFKTLANVAHASAAKTGQSYEHMLNSIILGTARESRLLLDNLGIIVNVTDAKKNYAKSLKEGADAAKYSALTVDQLASSLTDAGEKAAFFAAVQQQGAGTLKEQAKVGGTAADNFDRFAAAVDNLKTAIGKLLAEGGTSSLAKMAGILSDIAGYLDRIGKFGMVKKGGIVETVMGAVGSAYDAAKPYMAGAAVVGAAMVPGAGAAATSLGSMAWLASDLAEGPAENQRQATVEFAELAVAVTKAGLAVDQVPAMAKAIAEYPNEMLRAWGDEIFVIIPKLNKLGDALDIWVKGPKGPAASPDMVDPDKVAAAAAKEAAKGKATRDWVKKFDREMQEADDFIQQQGISLFSGIGKDVVDGLIEGAEESFMAFGAARKAAMQAESDAYREYENDLLAQASKDKQKTIEGATTGVDQAHSLLSGMMSGSAVAIGTSIGGFFGPLGVAIGGLIGELLDPLTPVIELLGHLAAGIKTLLEVGLNPFLARLEPLGPALEMLLNAVGILVGSALRALIPYLDLLVMFTTYVIDAFVFLIVVLAPVVEALVGFVVGVWAVIGLLWNIVSALSGGHLMTFADAMSFAAYRAGEFADKLADDTVFVHNGLVRFVRSLGRMMGDFDVFDLSHFGDFIQREDLMPDTTPIEENTDATGDNTRAVAQLSRDLRNLPSGYKVNYALYGATAPVRQYPGVSDSIGAANRSRYGGNPPNYRWRT